ncbi:BN159_2729 family protein [Streptomyces sp. NBC_01511]|uniref:BN159_2729 family protein n=1 Tax=Streptomyces sp. NBC_01511 TaxID=2903889 RepID=UPI00386837EE
MNKNLPHVIATIREVTGFTPDAANVLAQALNKAGLLADPFATIGIVLRKNQATGTWTRKPEVEPLLTELEQQTAAWDASCARATALSEKIRTECAEGSGLMRIRTDGDRLLVSVQVTEAGHWAAWRTYLGITEDLPQTLPYAYCGEGHRDGVAVSVVAYDGPQVEARVTAAARMPYRHGGQVYDLALPQQDSADRVWDFHSTRADGMPMLSMRGVDRSDAAVPLANVVHHVGPLAAVREQLPVPTVREPAPMPEAEVSA